MYKLVKSLKTKKARHKEQKFTVKFFGDDATLVSGNEIQTVSSHEEIVAPIYEKKGYEFVGWNIPFDKITEDTTINAEWSVLSYNIIYHLDGGTNDILNPTKYNVENKNVQ